MSNPSAYEPARQTCAMVKAPPHPTAASPHRRPRDHAHAFTTQPAAVEPTTALAAQTGYDMHCCNASAEEPFNPVSTITDFNCFVEAGAHIVHAEGFSGAKIDSLLTASECTHHDSTFNWQLNPRHPEVPPPATLCALPEPQPSRPTQPAFPASRTQPPAAPGRLLLRRLV